MGINLIHIKMSVNFACIKVHHSTAVHKACPYMVIVGCSNSQRRCVCYLSMLYTTVYETICTDHT